MTHHVEEKGAELTWADLEAIQKTIQSRHVVTPYGRENPKEWKATVDVGLDKMMEDLGIKRTAAKKD